nr:MAG TPA: hypothetical protein [Caudoviricetes sp.]
MPNVPVNPYDPVIFTDPPSTGKSKCVGVISIHLCA